MIEIHPGLFVGSDSDFSIVIGDQNEWWIIHACKEPYHRRLLGYTGRGAPKNHPEYLIARREKTLFLNLVDADNPAYIPKEIVDAALDWIDEGLRSGKRVLVHCNQGESRSPGIGLLYMASRTETLPRTSLADAEACFKNLYPPYNPKPGIRGFLLQYWDHYTKQRGQ